MVVWSELIKIWRLVCEEPASTHHHLHHHNITIAWLVACRVFCGVRRVGMCRLVVNVFRWFAVNVCWAYACTFVVYWLVCWRCTFRVRYVAFTLILFNYVWFTFIILYSFLEYYFEFSNCLVCFWSMLQEVWRQGPWFEFGLQNLF